MKTYLIFCFATLICCLDAQTNKDSIFVNKKQTKNWDTLKYHKFERVLIVGVFQQYRNFSNEFEQLINADTNHLSQQVYFAESKLTGGLVFNYDKFSLSFTTKTQPQDFSLGKGNTKVFNIGFNVGDHRWVLENYYRRFVGFYNKNTANFDTSFKHTGNYYLQPNLLSALFMSRFMYFSNHRNFSFKSGFGCNYRQLKSSATWIAGGSFNVYTLKNDSAILPIKARALFNDYSNLQGFQSVNFSCNVGAAGTLVLFKAWFINAYFTVGPEQQWRTYHLGQAHRHLSYVSWSGTSRISLGINMKRFYLLVANSTDYNVYNSPKIMNFTSSSITHNVTFGWRFHTKTPKFYQSVMNTKWYALI
jgi:hypothetical protein